MMPRNTNAYFSTAPQIRMQRSIIPRPNTHKTSFNFGECIPLYVDSDILPGDTVQASVSKIVRLQTMLTPVMDDMYFDTYWFFVPHRLVWDHWKEFCGENTESAWIQQTEYQVPTIASPTGGFNTGTIADYMGLPVGVQWTNQSEKAPIALPFRAYALIMQDWFRSEVVTDPLNIPTGDANQQGVNDSVNGYIDGVANGGKPFIASKFHDYFTSALKSPQKGPAVTFPLISGNEAPVHALYNEIPSSARNGNALKWYRGDNQATISTENTQSKVVGIAGVTGNTNYGTINYPSGTTAPNTQLNMQHTMAPANLWADLSSSVGSVTINELRLAFSLQHFYEQLAAGGSRYTEVIRSFFSVTSPDARQQRPEYLGGKRITINVHEVTNSYQEPGSDPTAFLGDLGAKSATADTEDSFIHSFTEHGTLLCIGVARYTHTYMGMEKMWTRKKFTDMYWPTFANIGYQPIFDYEIYPDSDAINNGTVFAYNEAWSDYRYKPSRVSGEMRPGVDNTLASWHLADYYTEKPTFSDSWMREDKTNVDRVLAVGSSLANQLFGDFFFNMKYTRVMPVFSIPGLDRM